MHINQNQLELIEKYNRLYSKGTSADKFKQEEEKRNNEAEKIRKKYKKIDKDEPEIECKKELLPELTNEIAPRDDNEQKNKPISNKGMPSLYECAEALKERVYIINFDDELRCFNGKCYDCVNSKDIITIYRKKVDNQLSGEKNMNTISQLHRFFTTDPYINIVKIESNQIVSVLNNGIYDVMEEKLTPHNPREILFSYVDANYVEHSKCEHFDKFICGVTGGNKILQKRLWMFLGYVLMQTTNGKAFFVMGEAPDSGKSLLGNFIRSLFLKRYVADVALNDFNGKFALARLVGSAVNISLDLPATKLNPTAVSRLKMMTGGDVLSITDKFIPDFSYNNRAKFIFATNSRISIDENDDAFWNRLVYMPFDITVPKSEQNKDLIKLFQKEKDAIVSKALHYARELVLLGFEFPSTPLIERKMREWQGKSNMSIEEFLGDCCVCGKECRGELVDNLYSEYENFCNNNGFVSQNRSIFKIFLEDQIGLKHFKMRDGGANPQSALRGIRLKGSGNYGN